MKAYKETIRKYYKYGNISTLTPVGSPTVTDGIASGFSASNYFQTPQVFNPLGSELEIVFKINLTTLGVSSLLLSQGATTQFHRLALWVNNSNKFCLYVGNGSSWLFSILSNLTLEAGIDYWLKFVYSDGVYYLYYSLDGVYYQLDSSIESSVTIPNMTTTAFIGFLSDSATGTNYLRGSMDLSKSYIKIDGKDWLHFTKVEETTEQDYDFYKDIDNYKLPSKVEAKYFKTLLEESTAGTYSVELPAGDYTIEMYGAGGGVSGNTYKGWHRIHGGGSGAGFKALVTLDAGTYNVTVGKGGIGRAVWNGAGTGDAGTPSTFGTLITCGAGTQGTGTGGVVTLSDELAIKEVYKNKDGEGGGYADVYNSWAQLNSGYSTYDGTHYGYGAGGWWYGNGPGTDTQNGLDGYCKIVGQITDDIERKYYKYQYTDFVRPNLTADGTMGGSEFAVRGANSGSYAYLAYDGNTSTYLALWTNSVNETYFYNPNPLKISTLGFTYYPSTWISKGEIYGSNDDENYVLLTTFSHSSNLGTVEVNNEIPYKYFKLKVISAVGHTGTGSYVIADIYELEINAKEQFVVEGTESDHDFYEEVYKKYYKYSDWTQPVLTSNTSSPIMSVSASNEGQGEAWEAFNGDSINSWATANSTPSGTLTAQFNNSIYVSSITVQGESNQWGSTNTITIYSDENKQNIIAQQKSFDYTISDTLNWTFSEPVKVNELVFDATGSNWVSIKDIKITAQQAVESTESDYDFYEEHRPTMKQEIITCYGIGE